MKEIKKKRIVQVFSDGSINFDYTVIKRLKKVNFYTKDHKNFAYNQKNIGSSFLQTSETFKTKYIL